MGDLPFDLYLITDLRAAGGPEALIARVQELLDLLGPRVAIQLRDKDAPPDVREALGLDLRRRTRLAGAGLWLNAPDGDTTLAERVDADGVHLPDGTVPRSTALPVACSAHDLPGLHAAAGAGAVFATLSPVLASPGKGPVLGWAEFARITLRSPIPVVALGGMLPSHGVLARSHGASAIAAIRSVLSPRGPEITARTFGEEPT